jgi:hypothetical protein
MADAASSKSLWAEEASPALRGRPKARSPPRACGLVVGNRGLTRLYDEEVRYRGSRPGAAGFLSDGGLVTSGKPGLAADSSEGTLLWALDCWRAVQERLGPGQHAVPNSSTTKLRGATECSPASTRVSVEQGQCRQVNHWAFDQDPIRPLRAPQPLAISARRSSVSPA